MPNQWPSTQPAEAADWAVQLAVDICADVLGRRHTEAVAVLAGKLRLLKLEGEADGLSRAHRIMDRATAAVLQREHQADVDEHGVDGWGA